jgi:hypothetical protein
MNPSNPYVYVDGEKLSMLGVAESLCLQLAPGKHTLSIRERFMFMPGVTSGTLDVDVTQGKPLFVRCSKSMVGARFVGTSMYPKEHNELQAATEEQWRARE